MPQLTRRRATADDVPFLLDLRRRTMDPHLAASGADTSQAQHVARLHYRFECADVLLQGDKLVGLLKVAREGTHWHVIQIQLVPEIQGKGLGRELLAEVIAQARASGAGVSLSVLKANPAKALYERMGFAVIGETGLEYDMRREA